jgi:nitrogenase molybdenum-iron protein alpha/beta subunit
MKVEVSNGEIVDKITILKIKSEKITDVDKLKNIHTELNELLPLLDEIGVNVNSEMFNELYTINSELWVIEDDLRELERKRDFGDEFIRLARAVYYTNDKRFEIKKRINLKTQSNFVEEKSYKQYN